MESQTKSAMQLIQIAQQIKLSRLEAMNSITVSQGDEISYLIILGKNGLANLLENLIRSIKIRR